MSLPKQRQLRRIIREIALVQDQSALTREEAEEYRTLEDQVSAIMMTPASYVYHERQAQDEENAKLVQRMNDLIKKAGARTLSDMDNIVTTLIYGNP